MTWLIALCIGYGLGAASLAVAVAVGQRLRENRLITDLDETIGAMGKIVADLQAKQLEWQRRCEQAAEWLELDEKGQADGSE